MPPKPVKKAAASRPKKAPVAPPPKKGKSPAAKGKRGGKGDKSAEPPPKRARKADAGPSRAAAAPAAPAAPAPAPPMSAPLPGVVDMDTFQACPLPLDWGSATYAKLAAAGTRNLARLMGKVVMTFVGVTPALLQQLLAAPLKDEDETLPPMRYVFDADGEYIDEPNWHIALSTLSSYVDSGKLKVPAADTTLTKDSLRHLYALQSPQSSQWGKPFIRVRSVHSYDAASKILHVGCNVYFGRLIFELISDGAIKHIVEHLVDIPGVVVPVEQLTQHEHMFNRADAELLQLKKYRFSLAGLLKHAENTGYPMCDPDPPGLTVPLYDYQKSSCQWMIDQEVTSRGLNYHFWQEWNFADGQTLFYFPLGGEFRFDRPPVTRGGLLCEEMGLGMI
jgi:hypothetical protein